MAEIGNNHEGDVRLAREMIGRAAEAGADAVKFQTIVPERLVAPDQTDRLRQLERFRLSPEDFERLSRAAAEAGVLFLSTPFDIDSVAWLDRLVPAFKIASGDNDFFPLLRAVAATGKPVLLSAGLADLDLIRRSRDTLRQTWRELGRRGELALLHCVVSYPTPPEAASLRGIPALASLGETVGYSDHTIGPAAAPLAVALGARIIEKHFTLNKQQSGFRDHQLSADPPELAELVRRVREAEQMLGQEGKRVQPAEAAAAGAARRSIVARHDLPAGARVAWEDLDWLRPRTGLAPGREDELLGRTLRHAVARGRPIRLEDLAPAAEGAIP